MENPEDENTHIRKKSKMVMKETNRFMLKARHSTCIVLTNWLNVKPKLIECASFPPNHERVLY